MTYGACFGDAAGAPFEHDGRTPGWARDPSTRYAHDLTRSIFTSNDDSVLTVAVGALLGPMLTEWREAREPDGDITANTANSDADSTADNDSNAGSIIDHAVSTGDNGDNDSNGDHADAIITSALRDAYASAVAEHPGAGWGSRFYQWSGSRALAPYGSYGNGSAMRVSTVGWLARDASECIRLARLTALPTHDHPEGVRGAIAIAMAVFLARSGRTGNQIRIALEWLMNDGDVTSMDRGIIEESTGSITTTAGVMPGIEIRNGIIGGISDAALALVPRGPGYYHYDVHRTVDGIIGHGYKFEVSCQKSVPEALCAVLDPSTVDYQSAVVNAIRLGGDADTQAAMAGGIAEAMWGMPVVLAGNEDSRLREAGLWGQMRTFVDSCPQYASIVNDKYGL